jgi:hypothetical protein
MDRWNGPEPREGDGELGHSCCKRMGCCSVPRGYGSGGPRLGKKTRLPKRATSDCFYYRNR